MGPILAICIFSVLAIHFVECSTKLSDCRIENAKVKVIQNLTDYSNQNPGIKLQPLIKVERFDETTNKIKTAYKFGRRINGNNLADDPEMQII